MLRKKPALGFKWYLQLNILVLAFLLVVFMMKNGGKKSFSGALKTWFLTPPKEKAEAPADRPRRSVRISPELPRRQ